MTLQEHHEQMARIERQQRLWYALFGAVAILSVVLFCFLGTQVIAPGPREIPVGKVDDYPINAPQRFAVEKLEVSSWADERPEVSDDILYVMLEESGDWFALLGLDMRTGCFLSWDTEQSLYTAPNDGECGGTRYTPDGRYLDGEHMDRPPRPMARLQVEVRDGNVFVIDKLFQAER